MPGGASTSAVERYDIRRRRWSRVRPMPLALNHTTATAHRGRLYVHGGYEGPLSQPTGALLRYNPRRTAGGGCRPRPPRARRTRPRSWATGSTWRAARTTRGSLRSLEIYDVARRRWTRGPSFPGPARNHTTGVASRRALLRARRARFAPTSRRPSATTRAGGAGSGCPTCARRAAASRRRGCATAASSCSAARSSSRAARRSPQVELFNPRTRRWRALPDMRTPRHGLGGAALGNRVFALEGGPRAGLRLLERDRVPRRPPR